MILTDAPRWALQAGLEIVSGRATQSFYQDAIENLLAAARACGTIFKSEFVEIRGIAGEASIHCASQVLPPYGHAANPGRSAKSVVEKHALIVVPAAATLSVENLYRIPPLKGTGPTHAQHFPFSPDALRVTGRFAAEHRLGQTRQC